MCNDTMCREHPLIPLLNPKHVLSSEIELNASVEYVSEIRRCRVHVHYCIEVDRTRNCQHIRILDYEHLSEADARLSNRISRNESDVDLARVEHFEHLA